MNQMTLSSCIVVSDGHHIYRAKRLLLAQKIKVYGSPRPGSSDVRGQRRLYWKRRQAGFSILIPDRKFANTNPPISFRKTPKTTSKNRPQNPGPRKLTFISRTKSTTYTRFQPRAEPPSL
jgi:hypothetical protein